MVCTVAPSPLSKTRVFSTVLTPILYEYFLPVLLQKMQSGVNKTLTLVPADEDLVLVDDDGVGDSVVSLNLQRFFVKF